MAPTTKELKAGDDCPNCGGAFVVDEEQDPQRRIERHSRNSAKPEHAARFAARTHEKAAEHGVIHRCADCGYRARFKPKGKAA